MSRNDVTAMLEQLMRESEELARATAGVGDDALRDVRRALLRTIEAGRDTLHDVRRDVGRYSEDAIVGTERYVKRNPWQSLGIAVGAGLVVGILIARR